MRLALVMLMSFLACTAALTGCRPSTGARQKPAAAVRVTVRPQDNPPPQKGLSWIIKGWGRTQAEADADAVQRATAFLADFIHQQKPPLAVTPSPAYVRTHLMYGPSQRKEELDQEIERGQEAIKMQCWTMTLAVSPQDYAALVQVDRQARLQHHRSERMILLAKVVVGVLALLAAVLGYLRMEQWAKRRCTRRLRVAVAAVLVAVVVGLLFLS
jgi:hypothetical protein